MNPFVVGSRLVLALNEQTFPISIANDRIKLLLLKYETPTGEYFTYRIMGSTLKLDEHSTDYSSHTGELDIVYAAYGNETKHLNVLQKMRHYKFFRWEHFTVSRELFPSLIDNGGEDYQLLIYVNKTGIHAISCSEGERIRYSPDRLRLYVSSPNELSYIVNNVPRLGFGKGLDCSWAGAFYTSLRTMGIETSYEEVMGVSGACWRVAFAPIWDYISADGLVGYDYADPAFQAYGYKPVWANRIGRDERKLEKLHIMESINKLQVICLLKWCISSNKSLKRAAVTKGKGIYEKNNGNSVWIIIIMQPSIYVVLHDEWRN